MSFSFAYFLKIYQGLVCNDTLQEQVFIDVVKCHKNLYIYIIYIFKTVVNIVDLWSNVIYMLCLLVLLILYVCKYTFQIKCKSNILMLGSLL